MFKIIIGLVIYSVIGFILVGIACYKGDLDMSKDGEVGFALFCSAVWLLMLPGLLFVSGFMWLAELGKTRRTKKSKAFNTFQH